MSSLLVFGRSGQLGTELQRLTQLNIVALGRDQADLSDPIACDAAIHAHTPHAVINAAAYTAVDAAESDETLATQINGAAPAVMAKACAALQIPFVHISTDYVFAGTGTRPWRPKDSPAPQNAYGRSKLAGEEGIRAAGGHYVILRTSWVFSAYGGNFVKTMLSLSKAHDRLNVVADQTGGPTSAGAIAQACLSIADQLGRNPAKSGTYHFSGAPDVSWYDFAHAIFATAGRNTTIHPIATTDYPTPATRPLNSRLDCQGTEQTFGLTRPDWRTALHDVIEELEHQT